MAVVVTAGANLQCTMGTAPATLTVTSQVSVLAEGKPVATVQDAMPLTNISPCGLCTSMMNPQVAAATAAALGVLTPQPCVPSTGAWIPSQTTVLAEGKPALTKDAKCKCAYMGDISIINPGQAAVGI